MFLCLSTGSAYLLELIVHVCLGACSSLAASPCLTQRVLATPRDEGVVVQTWGWMLDKRQCICLPVAGQKCFVHAFRANTSHGS